MFDFFKKTVFSIAFFSVGVLFAANDPVELTDAVISAFAKAQELSTVEVTQEMKIAEAFETLHADPRKATELEFMRVLSSGAEKDANIRVCAWAVYILSLACDDNYVAYKSELKKFDELFSKNTIRKDLIADTMLMICTACNGKNARTAKCPNCKGALKCPTCKGTGIKKEKPSLRGSSMLTAKKTIKCPACNGSKICSVCNGKLVNCTTCANSGKILNVSEATGRLLKIAEEGGRLAAERAKEPLEIQAQTKKVADSLLQIAVHPCRNPETTEMEVNSLFRSYPKARQLEVSSKILEALNNLKKYRADNTSEKVGQRKAIEIAVAAALKEYDAKHALAQLEQAIERNPLADNLEKATLAVKSLNENVARLTKEKKTKFEESINRIRKIQDFEIAIQQAELLCSDYSSDAELLGRAYEFIKELEQRKEADENSLVTIAGIALAVIAGIFVAWVLIASIVQKASEKAKKRRLAEVIIPQQMRSRGFPEEDPFMKKRK